LEKDEKPRQVADLPGLFGFDEFVRENLFQKSNYYKL